MSFDPQAGLVQGVLVSAGLALVSYGALRWAAGKSHQTFTGVLLGGFVVRLMIFGAVLFWVLKFSNLNGTAFTVALVGSYLIFQFLETMFLHKQLKTKEATKRMQAVDQ